MDRIMWDFQIGHTGGSLSNFQMEVFSGDRHSRHDLAPRRSVLTSVLAMLSPVVALFLMR